MAKEVEIGTRFGAWVVVKKLDYKQKYTCRCDCGREQNIRVYDLLHGKSTMCRSCSVSVAKTSHGHSTQSKVSSEYNTWTHMIQRCHNPKNKDYPNYGGRGIIVCDMWRESFEAFFMMMGKKPTPKYTIERIDSNGNYEPGNCRWATRAEQTRNKGDNVNITIDGETKTVSEWSRDPRCSVNKYTIYKRLKRDWEPERAVLEK